MDFLPPLCKNNSSKTNPNRVVLAADGSSNALSRKSRCCSSLGPEVTQLCCWHSVKELLEMLSGRLMVQSTLKCFLINGTASSGLLQRHTMTSGTLSELPPPLSSAGAVWEPLVAADAGTWLKVTAPGHCIAAASHTARQRNRHCCQPGWETPPRTSSLTTEVKR